MSDYPQLISSKPSDMYLAHGTIRAEESCDHVTIGHSRFGVKPESRIRYSRYASIFQSTSRSNNLCHSLCAITVAMSELTEAEIFDTQFYTVP